MSGYYENLEGFSLKEKVILWVDWHLNHPKFLPKIKKKRPTCLSVRLCEEADLILMKEYL